MGKAANVFGVLEKQILRQKSGIAEDTHCTDTKDFCARNQRKPVLKEWCKREREQENGEYVRTTKATAL